MEYTVGSLADLITGSDTPDKPKVIEKKVKRKEKPQTEAPNEEPPIPPQPSKKVHKPAKEIFTTDFIRLNMDQDREVPHTESKGERKPKSQNVINAQRRVERKETPEKVEYDPEISARTLFIGNFPFNLEKKKILQHFKKYGFIESVRIRGVAPENPKITKRIAAIKNQLHPKRNSVLCYIRFKNREDCLKALEENGKVFNGHHLRVSTCDQQEKPDEAKAIFVGNLSFDAEEEELWELFKDCGPISYVRIIRDSRTMMGKGFAYVNFQDSDSVQLAIEMENVKLRDRELRISLCNSNVARKNRSSDNRKQITKSGKPKKMRWRNRDKKADDGNDNVSEVPVQQSEENLDSHFPDKIKKVKEVEKEENEDSKVVNKKKKKKRKNEHSLGQSEEIQDSQIIDKKKKRKKMNNGDVNEVPTQHSKEYQGSQFTDKKKKHKANKGLLEKKKKIKAIAPK